MDFTQQAKTDGANAAQEALDALVKLDNRAGIVLTADDLRRLSAIALELMSIRDRLQK